MPMNNPDVFISGNGLASRDPHREHQEVSARPLAIDLFSGLGGWAEGLEAEGFHVRRYDLFDMFAETGTPKPDGLDLVLRDVLTIHGAELADADLIVASPPCQEFSYMAMPWGRAKQIGRALRGEDVFPEGYRGSRTLAELTALFDACFRIQRECNEARAAMGLPPVPMVVENVKGAQPWVGRAPWSFGSYFLWGDIPALMPRPQGGGVKVGGMGWYPPDDPRHQVGAAFNPAAQGKAFAEAREGRKVPGFRFDGSGRSFQTASVEGMKNAVGSWFAIGSRGQKVTGKNPVHAHVAEGRKGAGAGAEWFDENLCKLSSKSSARKAASAKIAKIPEALSRHIARVYLPAQIAERAA